LAWRSAIASQVTEALAGMPPIDMPCGLTVHFYLTRPVSAPKRRRYPERKPDLDKLARAVLDGITGIAITDDARIVSMFVHKHYAVDQPTGAHLVLWPVDGESGPGPGSATEAPERGAPRVMSDAVGTHQTTGAGIAPPGEPS